jgi:uncharacterized protein involved in high-affinity Fe2+ transport
MPHFHIDVAAYDNWRGSIMIEAPTWEEAIARMAAEKLHHDIDMEPDGDIGPYRVCGVYELEAEDAIPNGDNLVVDDPDIPGEDQMFLAYSDEQKEGFALFNSLTKDQQKRAILSMAMIRAVK